MSESLTEGVRVLPLQDQLAAAKRLAERENTRGGEARGVVLDIAMLVGVDLTRNVLGGDVWSAENMRRVVVAVEGLQYQLARRDGRHGSFHGGTPEPVRYLNPDLAARALATAVFGD